MPSRVRLIIFTFDFRDMRMPSEATALDARQLSFQEDFRFASTAPGIIT